MEKNGGKITVFCPKAEEFTPIKFSWAAPKAQCGAAADWPSDVQGGGVAADLGALRRRAERIASPGT